MKGYVMVYADNLLELANGTVYLHLEVAEAILPNVRALHEAAEDAREIWIQPIEIDGRTPDKLSM